MPDTPRNFIRWNPRGSGSILKWNAQEPGFSIEGIWLGAIAGPYGQLGQLELADKTVRKFPLTAVLRDRLATLPRGCYIVITYLGQEISRKTEKPFHTFEVLVDAATIDELAALPPDDKVPF